MLDFSKTEDLRPLARLVAAIGKVSDQLPFILAGAQARDLLLKYAHDIPTGRQTSDVDFAFRVESWDEFHTLRKRLLESGAFVEVPKSLHKLKFRAALEVDIVPFGGIERSDRTIEWPPDGDVVMSLFGFEEVMESALTVHLPEDVFVKSVSLPALALLKFAAWEDRRRTHPGKDAYDLRIILKHYVDAGNVDRLYGEFSALVTAANFDYERAGAHMLGHDIGLLLNADGRRRLRDQLSRETDRGGRLALLGDLGLESEKGLQLLDAVAEGLQAAP